MNSITEVGLKIIFFNALSRYGSTISKGKKRWKKV